jgi:hypothetical protein
MNRIEYDLHLAASRISPHTVTKLSVLGFRGDGFSNYVRCETGEYHASFTRTERLPDDNLWRSACLLLERDACFSGYLEMEEEPFEFRGVLLGTSSSWPPSIPAIPISRCPAEPRKACDLHIGIELSQSTSDAIARMDQLEISSVDKSTSRGTRRIYTVTFTSLDDGEDAFSILLERLNTIPGLRGKMKLERVVKCFRKPPDATTLPIVPTEAAKLWFNSVKFLSLSDNALPR